MIWNGILTIVRQSQVEQCTSQGSNWDPLARYVRSNGVYTIVTYPQIHQK